MNEISDEGILRYEVNATLEVFCDSDAFRDLNEAGLNQQGVRIMSMSTKLRWMVTEVNIGGFDYTGRRSVATVYLRGVW